MASNKPDNSEAKLKPKLPDNERVSAEMAASIKSQLTAGLREAARGKVFVPTFKEWTHTEETLRATCSDTRTLDWLTKAVERIPETSEGKFQVIQEDQLTKVPKLTGISLFIPGAKVKEMDDIEKLLVLQNSNIKVDSWRLFSKVQKDNGLLIFAGIVDEDVDAIMAQGGIIFYELSTVKVKIFSAGDFLIWNS